VRRRKLIWQLFPSYLLISLVAIVSVTWYSIASLHQFYLQETAKQLQIRTRLLRDEFVPLLKADNLERVDELCKELGGKSTTRITVILPVGAVAGDTDEDPAVMDNHLNRPEVAKALGGGIGTSVRFSKTVQQQMLYLAAPISKDGEIIGVLRVSIPVASVNRALSAIQWAIVTAAIVAAVFAAVISLFISRHISRPLENIKLSAEKFAKGELAHRIVTNGSEEIAGLGRALNDMASRLDSMLAQVVQQRNQMDVVLAGMNEGVVAVGIDGRIIIANRTAAELFNVDPTESLGRNLEEIAQVPALLELVSRTLDGETKGETLITVRDEDERIVKAAASLLRDSTQNPIGTLVVLTDVTKETKFERIRKDFVANVSHELRTPITAIKGFSETLLDRSVEAREDVERFLRTIVRHADRLNSIIEDLLILSRLEQEAEQQQIALSRSRIKPVLERAAESLATLSVQLGVQVRVDCANDLKARINSSLLEQAVMNLIDNAVKYGGRGKSVHVTATETDGEIVISVADEGDGISREHIDRIFERFYRADKQASRQFGGTGLGLAIVKHVALVHGGSASVESTPGKGSIFYIHLPAS